MSGIFETVAFERAMDFVRDLFVLALFLVGGLLMLFGAFVLSWQAWRWLQTGGWMSLSLIDGWLYAWGCSWECNWLIQPDRWIGVHKIVSAVPVSVGAFMCGGALWVAGRLMEVQAEQERQAAFNQRLRH